MLFYSRVEAKASRSKLELCLIRGLIEVAISGRRVYELSKIDKTNRTMPFIILASLLLSIFCIGYISGVGADGTAFVSLNNIQQIAHRHHHTAVALKKGGTKKKKVQSSTITVNKLAFRNYEVLETWEAGISLVGTEVKRFV